MAALGPYVTENVSLGCCSQISGMREEEFMRFLGADVSVRLVPACDSFARTCDAHHTLSLCLGGVKGY